MIKRLLFLGSLLLLGCDSKERLFDLPSKEITGIAFTNSITETEDLNILDYLYFYNGGGVAIGDINSDGLPDIFFSGNQVENKLYLNKGNLTFEDITKTAGVAGNSTWNTGAVMGDVNGDGLLDIYVCAVVGIFGFDGHNELFINKGNGTFTEMSAEYKLDHDSYSSNAAFLDYDLDGDLDIYLLNHAVHTQESFGKADLRNKRNYETGDKLLRNDGDIFTDVSEEAGIYGGINGYGLGISVSDFNQDGYPDLYVGNDFHEDDYYYLNNQDGTFSEKLRDYFGHTSRFSMGNDVADINHDGWPDLISLDMLAEDEKVLKASEGDDDIQIQKLRIERYGYHYQYTRNMLYVNQQGYDFQETALLSGIAATDWSWSALFADFDQDSEQDLFISNGIPKRPNDLDYINFVSNEQIQNKMNNTKLVDQKALELMPRGNVHNFVFQGKGALAFDDRSGIWMAKDTIISGATAMADLDADGDLDLVTNNLNRVASIYENITNEKANYLQIRFQWKDKNPYGIGTKVFSYLNGSIQYKELYTVRGFQASSEPMIHFGFGSATVVDSLRIIWPDGTHQVHKKVNTNQKLTLSPEGNVPFNYNSLRTKTPSLFRKIENNLGINFTHEEDAYLDFNREKLIPYQVSDRGPAMAIGDLNGDGKDDVFFGSSKFKESKLYVQNDTTFLLANTSWLSENNVTEDVSAAIADFNQDGKNDLYVGTGGADFRNQSPALLDAYFVQGDTTFVKGEIPSMYQNASVVAPADYDQDGDLDLFVGNQSITNHFGAPGTSYFLKNEQGRFSIDSENDRLSTGMITDAIWTDFDSDGVDDLITIGEWMEPQFYSNQNGILTEIKPLEESLHGLWQAIAPFDIDNDGDLDYLLGNWGTNSKFSASKEAPMKMYINDFDKNGQSETIVVTKKDGNYFPLSDFSELSSQLVSLKKKYNTHQSFAGQTVQEIFSKKQLSESQLLEIDELRSGYLKNEGGRFTFIAFDNRLQVAPILSFCIFDFDKDGRKEALAAGNYFGVKPFQGRLDSFSGAWIQNEESPIMAHTVGLDFAQKSVRDLSILTYQEKEYLIVTYNNEPVELYQITK